MLPRQRETSVASELGRIFRITTFGESHGGGVGVVVDGCPPRLRARRWTRSSATSTGAGPGRAVLTTPRQEADRVEILSGVFEGLTLGTPIALLVRNEDARPSAYEDMQGPLPPLARRLHHRGEVRDPQLAGRRTRERARDGRPRGRRGAIARKLLRRSARDRGARLGQPRPRDRGEGRSRRA